MTCGPDSAHRLPYSSPWDAATATSIAEPITAREKAASAEAPAAAGSAEESPTSAGGTHADPNPLASLGAFLKRHVPASLGLGGTSASAPASSNVRTVRWLGWGRVWGGSETMAGKDRVGADILMGRVRGISEPLGAQLVDDTDDDYVAVSKSTQVRFTSLSSAASRALMQSWA